MFIGDFLIQVQVRLSNNSIKTLDKWIKKGCFENRSDAIRRILSIYENKQKTLEVLNSVNNKKINNYDHELKLLEKGINKLKEDVKNKNAKYYTEKEFNEKYKYLKK